MKKIEQTRQSEREREREENDRLSVVFLSAHKRRKINKVFL